MCVQRAEQVKDTDDKLKALKAEMAKAIFECDEPKAGIATSVTAQTQLQLVMNIMAGGELKINEINSALIWMLYTQQGAKGKKALVCKGIKSFLKTNHNKRLGRQELWDAVLPLMTDKNALSYQVYLQGKVTSTEKLKEFFNNFKFKTIALSDRYRRSNEVIMKLTKY